MVKGSIALVYVGIVAVLAVLLIQLVKEKQRYINDIRALFILGILMNGGFIVSLYLDDVLMLEVIYTFVLICESWIIYLFMRYAYSRSFFYERERRKYRGIAALILVAENLFLVLNAFTKVLFGFNHIPIEDSVYVYAQWSWFSIMHFVMTIIMQGLVVFMMVKKAIAVASVYRGRYIWGVILFSVAIILNSGCRIFTNNMNMLSIVIVSICIVSYYYMYFKLPLLRALRMKTFAINNMSEPVLMFDYNNNLQVYNNAAEELLDVYTYYKFENYIADNELQINLADGGKNKDHAWEFMRTKFTGAKTYLIHGQELWDEKDKFVGTLIVYSDISGQERLKDEATLYATRDQLTGLWNRDYFFEMVAKTIRENPETEFVMVASDIFQFKMFNEILGVEAGDDLLMAIAQMYRQRYKRNWVFSRIAGDRFALFLPKHDFRENVFMEVVHEVLSKRSYSMKVHCYLGVYEVTDRHISAEGMYDRAYMALESIKGHMEREIAYYHEELLQQRIVETTTIDEMDRAILNNEFVIFLQPQIDIRTGSVVSSEALIRWDKPGRGIVSPGEFIPIFEKNGMIAKLDYYVWELACKQIYFWEEMGYTNRSISVNISAKDFYLSDLYESITGLVEKYDINPSSLKLEITETAFVLDVKKQMELVKSLQDYGFIIEIDDFGSGYSTLNSLKDISVDILKMDLKFFEKTEEAGRAECIIRSVINLANELGMPVIAEGVETKEDVEMLKEAGCQMVQGYFYAKPMSVSDYEKFVLNRPFKDMKEIIKEVKK